MRFSPPFPRTSIRQHFLYHKGRRSRVSVRCPLVRHPFPSPAAANRSNCRKDWDLSIKAMNLAGFPLRQWLIGLSGLACGMSVALLIR